jgi:hypothetical protein
LPFIVIDGYHAEMVIQILAAQKSSAPPGAARKRRRTSAVPSCHDLKRRQVIRMKNSRSD